VRRLKPDADPAGLIEELYWCALQRLIDEDAAEKHKA
jgi:hypothetical protein